MKIKAIRGTKDILPADCQLWRAIEKKAHSLCAVYGYRQIHTPLLEEAGLFVRSIGKSSDIVRKEMYSFLDRKNRLLCLRPEATASVVRAYLEHGLDKSLSLAKFYYFGPMFRAERPQAGRLRQFHHLGVEAIGSGNPYLDGEVISLAVRILQSIGVKKFALQLNSIGCAKDRKKYKLILRKQLKSKLRLLSTDCRRRCKVNILRIFDCKNELCRSQTRQLPSIVDYLCPSCAEHLLQVKQILDSLNITYLVNPHLVRGLDYYTKTCFELTHPALGAQNAIGAGGRYDDLVEELGGAPRPAVGFALGLERLISALGVPKIEHHPKLAPQLYIATLGAEAKQMAFRLLDSLRQQGISSEMNYLDKSLKAQMRLADKLAAKYVAILGDDELKKKTIILRNMQEQTQQELKLNQLVAEIK